MAITVAVTTQSTKLQPLSHVATTSDVRVHTFQSNDLRRRVHDGRIGSDGAPNGVGRVTEIDDDHLGRLPHLLSHTDELIGLHCERGKANLLDVDANILELE